LVGGPPWPDRMAIKTTLAVPKNTCQTRPPYRSLSACEPQSALNHPQEARISAIRRTPASGATRNTSNPRATPDSPSTQVNPPSWTRPICCQPRSPARAIARSRGRAPRPT